jgi:hypothetical protein
MMVELDAPRTVLQLARHMARNKVTTILLAQGWKLRDLTRAELHQFARHYLDQHEELMQQAAEAIRRHPRLMRLALHEYRERQIWVGKSNITTYVQRKSPCSDTTIPVHISRTKLETE